MTDYPPSGPASFDELVAPLPREIREIATRLRAVIRSALPTADEAVSGGAKMGMALYSVGAATDVVCGFQPTRDAVKLFFHGWEALKAAGYRLEGSGRHARHVKVRSSGDLETLDAAEMIRIAAEAVSARAGRRSGRGATATKKEG